MYLLLESLFPAKLSDLEDKSSGCEAIVSSLALEIKGPLPPDSPNFQVRISHLRKDIFWASIGSQQLTAGEGFLWPDFPSLMPPRQRQHSLV